VSSSNEDGRHELDLSGSQWGQRCVSLNVSMNLRFPHSEENLLFSWGAIRFTKRICSMEL